MLEGDIHEINLVERLVQLWRERFTGALRFENDGVIKIIYYKEGDILSASTNDRADSVDEILMKAGKVSKEHVKQALAKRKESETLGDALLNLGFITRKELTWARRIQVINVIRSIEQWTAGTFTIVADYLPKREEGTMFPLPQLVVEMIVTDQDRGKFEKLLESGTAVFEKAAGQDETFRKLGLNEDAEAVMAHVDGERTASEVAASSRQETFNAFKLLHALSVIGILERRGVPQAVPMGAFESVGVADAQDAWGSPSAQFNVEDVPAPISPPARMPEPPAAVEEEAKWGFDEVQIETSRKATIDRPLPAIVAPSPKPRVASAGTGTITRRAQATKPAEKAKAKEKRYGWLIALIVLFVAGVIGYFSFSWWTSREAAAAPQALAPTPAATRPAIAAPVVATLPPPPETVAPVTTTTAATAIVPPSDTAGAAAGAPPATARARYDAMAQEFARNPANFAVQFAIVCDPSNVTKALQSSGRGDVWFMPITLKDRSCFRMFWGRFATREEADRSLSRLPGELRESRPAVVAVRR